MAYDISWMNAPSVLHMRLEGDVKQSDYGDISQTIQRALEEGQPRTALVIDITHAKTIPFPNESVRSLQTYTRHPNLKWIIIVGENKLIRLMLLLTLNASKISLSTFNNYEQTETYLHLLNLQNA